MKNWFFFLIMVYCSIGFSQSKQKVDSVFNYFTNNFEKFINVIGKIELVPYGIAVSKDYYKYFDTISSNELIFLNDKPLFKFEIKGNCANGLGYAYYPISGNIALKAQFINGKIDGFVFVHDSNGEVIEIMKFHRGIYKRHSYCIGIGWISKKLVPSQNPLRNDFPNIKF